MDVADLLVRLRVKSRDALARRRLEGLFEIARQAAPGLAGLVADLVGLVDAAGAVCSLDLVVEGGEGVGEAVRDAMFVVQRDCALQGGVGDGVAVGEVLGHDAGAGFVFLGEFFGAAGVVVAVAAGGGAGEFGHVGCGGHLDLGGAELGVVEEESRFGCAVGV